MLKKRIIGVVIVKGDISVQSKSFSRYLPLGKPEIAIEFLNQWGVDEIIMLDISASRKGVGPNLSLVSKVAQKCLVPLTVGGGVSNIDQIHQLMQCGADKISLNQATFNNHKFITQAAKVFGNQCIVASIDAIKEDNEYYVYNYIKERSVSINPTDFAKKLQDIGAGEIFLNNITLDGSQTGFDISLINMIANSISIPLICCGGAGMPKHFLEVLTKTNVSGVAAANLFNYFEHSVTIIKSIAFKDHPIRHDSTYTYNEANFCELGRVQKKSDKILEKMLFEKIEKEVI